MPRKKKPDSEIIYQYRQVTTRAVTFTCDCCKKTVTQQRFPGPLPRYCCQECRYQNRLASQRELMRRRRADQPKKKRGRPPKNKRQEG